MRLESHRTEIIWYWYYLASLALVKQTENSTLHFCPLFSAWYVADVIFCCVEIILKGRNVAQSFIFLIFVLKMHRRTCMYIYCKHYKLTKQAERTKQTEQTERTEQTYWLLTNKLRTQSLVLNEKRKPWKTYSILLTVRR